MNDDLRAQSNFNVVEIGDWNAPADNSLAYAWQNAIGGDTITLNDLSWTDGGWLNWPTDSSATYTGLSTDNKALTVILSGKTLSGTPLDILTGTGSLNFKNGTLGDSADHMRIGYLEESTVVFDSVSLRADSLRLGNGVSLITADVTLNGGSSISANNLALSGLGTQLQLNDASTLTTNSGNLELSLGSMLTSTSSGLISVGGNLSLISGGRFNASGPVTVSGNLSVDRAGVWERKTDPVTYSVVQSLFEVSGNLTFNGNTISATNGGKIDLRNATFGPWAIGDNKSITVSGIFTHKESAKSFASELVWNNTALNVSGSGWVDVSDGGVFRGVTSITLQNGGAVTVDGAFLDSDSNKEYRSKINAGGALAINSATLNVDNGALVDGITSIVVNDNGTLNVRGSDAVTGFDSTVAAGGTFTLGGTTVGTLTMSNGAKLTGVTNMSIGGSAQAVVDLSGVGSGNTRTDFTASGTLTIENADIDIAGGALWSTTGKATLGASGRTTLLDIGGHAGSGNGFFATLKTGDIVLGDTGTVNVNITRGGTLVTEDAVLAKEAGSTAEITINENYDPGVHRAWTVGGDGIDPGVSKGRSFLSVTAGMVDVKGFLSMGSQGYTGSYGYATFTGNNAELHMNGGTFRNQGDGLGSTIGKIVIGDESDSTKGGIVSGSGNIIAGDQFIVNGGTITPGGRWMYNFDRDKKDELTCIGTLNITDSTSKATKFSAATFQTQLEREGLKYGSSTEYKQTSDQAYVNGALEVSGLNINISRVLTGDYMLISADAITGYPGYAFNGATDIGFALNLNGKTLVGNKRVDATYDHDGDTETPEISRMYSEKVNMGTADEIRLHVKTLTDGNVISHWTGATSGAAKTGNGTWDMISKNFEAGQTANTEQFLDGDIVIFRGEWMKTKGYLDTPHHPVNDVIQVNITNDPDKYKANVIVPEVRVYGDYAFDWSGGGILAYDSALYTTLDQASGYVDPETLWYQDPETEEYGKKVGSPSGRLVKVGTGVLTINNANEFYGGIHLGGDDPSTEVVEKLTGGKIVLNNPLGFGTYNSMSGFQEKGLVYVHEDTVIDVRNIGINPVTGELSITNRFIVDPGQVLTFLIDGKFVISNNNALAGSAIQEGKGGGIFIGNEGVVEYVGAGGLVLTNNQGKMGGGIYTELGYTLKVPADISGNYAQSGGGGIYAEKFFELQDSSSISSNTTNKAGGGIYIGNHATLFDEIDKDDPNYDDLAEEASKFILHGNTVIQKNQSGGETGGGVFVEAGRKLVLSTEKEGNFVGGDIWFVDNYAKIEFNPDDPTKPVNSPDKIRNAIHLSRTDSDPVNHDTDPDNDVDYTGAKLDISGPYNTYFYDPVSGDTGTEITILGVPAVPGTNTETTHNVTTGQAGTVIFHDDSIFFGDTNVLSGATFRLETNSEGAEAFFGRRGSLATNVPTDNTFIVDKDSSITGQGTIAADAINLAGKINLDTGIFSRPGLPLDADGKPTAALDGSGKIADADAKTQGVLKLDGKVEVTDTSKWNLNLTDTPVVAGLTTDRIDVTGSVKFTGSDNARKMELTVDEVVRGRHVVMTASGGFGGSYNADRKASGAEILYDMARNPAAPNWIDLVTDSPLTDTDPIYYGRMKTTSYVGTGNENTNLYLDIDGRNRFVTAGANGNWKYVNTWTFDAAYNPNGTGGTTTWSRNAAGDSGPETTVYLDGDMVLLTGGTMTLDSKINPVDLFVQHATNAVTIQGDGITTFSLANTSTSTVYGQDKTTIWADTAANTAKTNDYGVRKYTGKLYKSLGNTLTFDNAANLFSEGIEFGYESGAAGTISFGNVNQLIVGSGKTIDFKESGALAFTGASGTLLTSTGDGTNIRVGGGKTATVNVTNELKVSGVISNISGNGTVVKTGAGSLALSNANTFTGGATLQAGTILLGHDKALSVWPAAGADPAASKAGQLDVTGTGTVAIEEDRTVSNRFDVTGSLTFDLDGDTFVIENVKTSNGANGGAIRVETGGSIAFDASGGNLVMSGNTSTGGGGAIYSKSALDLSNLDSVTFSGNQTTTFSGGAIYAEGNLTFGTHILVSGNRSEGTGGGGAVLANQNVTLVGNTFFENNLSGAGGGAVFAAGTSAARIVTLNTTTGAIAFTGNRSGVTNFTTPNGTANSIHLAKDTQLQLTGDGSSTYGVYFDDPITGGNAAGNGFVMATAFKGVAQFAGNSVLQNNAFTTINSGTMRVVKDASYTNGSGAFTLAADGTLAGGGTLTSGGNFNISGILAPDSDRFTTPTFNKATNAFGAEKTTIAEANRIGTLTFRGASAGSAVVNLNGNTTSDSYQLDLNLKGVIDGTVYDKGEADLIKVDGTFNVVTNSQTNKIIVNLHNYTLGKYILIDSNTLTINGGASGVGEINGIDQDGAFDVLIHDFAKTDRHRVSFMRGNEKIVDTDVQTISGNDPNGINQLWITTRYNNLYTYWTGENQGDGAANLWQGTNNEANGNWYDVNQNSALNSGEEHFENEDTVVFTDSVPGHGATYPKVRAITLGSKVVVTAMIVDTDDTFSFAGVNLGISTSATYSGDVLDHVYGANGSGTAPKTLTKMGEGTLTFTNTGGNTFAGGIVFADNGTSADAGEIAFGRADQLGDGGNGITFTESGTLKSTAAITALTNNLHIANGKTATFNTNAYNVTLGGKIDEVGTTDTGHFIKDGTGTLTLNNAANAWQGATDISRGTLIAVGVGAADGAGSLGINSAARTVTLSNSANLTLQIAGTETMKQKIAGIGSVTKSGDGTLTVDNTNTYTGNTTITGTGTLIAKGIAALGTDANGKQVSSTTGGTLNLEVLSTDTDTTLNQLLTGTNLKFTKTGNGTLTIGRTNSYTGATAINDGGIVITNVAGLGTNAAAQHVTIASGAFLEINATGTFSKSLDGAGRLVVSGGALILNTANNAASPVSFTGGTTLSAGSLTLSNANALNNYTEPGGTKGQVDVTGTGTKTISLNSATNTTFSNRFNLTGGTLVLTNVAGRNHTIDLIANSNTDGGAVAVADNTTLQLNNPGTITFTGNADSSGPNDIYLGGTNASLSITGGGNAFFGSGIRGTGTVSKTGNGLTQVGAASRIAGSTTVDAATGRFRVNGSTTTYENTGGSNKFDLVAGTLEGNGTVKAPTVTITGKISPDTANLNAGNADTSLVGSIATLTLSGTTVNLGDTGNKTFTMDYDLGTPYSGTGAIPATTGDLLKITDASTVNLYGGTVDFRGTLRTGSYLVVDANQTIMVNGGDQTKLDGINVSGGVLKAKLGGVELTGKTPRYGLGYRFDDGSDTDSQIWLDVERNTLTMDWTNASATTWGDDVAGETFWQSKQWAAPGTAGLATVFNNGDYVNFTGAGVNGQTINVVATGVTVSGMTFDNDDKGLAFSGGGITSRVRTGSTDTDITGKFVDGNAAVYAPQVPVDGKLTKSGTGILTFTNTGNTFGEGINLGTALKVGGTIRFSNGNQLQVGSGKQISVLNTGGLYYNGAGNGELQTAINIGATLTYTVVNSYTLTQSGLMTGAGAFIKTGGTPANSVLDLTNQGNTFSGNITVVHGTLASLNVAALGWNDDARVINLQSADSILNVRQTVTSGNELNQHITGVGKVTKSGDENLILTHVDNSYSGGTTVAAGTLTAKHAWLDGTHRGSIGTGPVTLTLATSVLDFNILEDGSFAGTIGGIGKVELNADQVLTLSAVSGYTGETNINDGKIVITNVAAVGGNTAAGIVNIAAGSALEINAAGTFSKSLRGAGSLIKSGTASLTLDTDNSAANAFTGGTTMSGGGLTLGNVGALNTYTNAGGTKGLVTLTGGGEKTVTLGADGTYRNRFDVTAGTFTLTDGAGNDNTIGIGASSNTNGGAVALGSGTTMNLNNAGSLTFTGNQDTSGGNDVYMDSATLNIIGAGNAFFGGGIHGTGNVVKTAASTGLTQIGANSSIDGSTSINAATGRFRVNGTGTTYENIGVGHAFTLTAGILEGNGTVAAPTITINGKISPDNDTLSATDSAVATAGDERFGKLTLAGAVTLNGFVMAYDANELKKQNSKVTTANIDTGDLLRITGTSSLVGGTIDLQTSSLGTGYYLVAESNTAFSITGGNGELDGINDGGVLKLSLNGSTLTHLTPRTLYEFSYGANSTGTADARVWLHADTNSLTMDWNVVAGSWNWNADDANWYSVQATDPLGTNVHETKFRNGDYARFNVAGNSEISIAASLIVSGFTVDGANNTTFKGDGGVHSKISDSTYIIGKYLDYSNSDPEKLTPDGKLIKTGAGVLTFENEGGNTFDGGIEIGGGTVIFNRANQIGTGAAGIMFTATANAPTLRAAAAAVLTNNITVAANMTGTLDPQGYSLTFHTGTVRVENGGTLNLVGSGNMFYDAGIQGTGATLSKSGTGIVQIAETSAFSGATTVSDGTFRVVNGKVFGGNGSFALNQGKTLAGNGTIRSTNTIHGIVSPDADTFSVSHGDVDPSKKFAILTFNGDTTFDGTFRFTHDVDSPYTGTGSLNGLSGTTTGDLIALTGGTYTIAKGAIIDLVTGNTLSLTAGAYHVMSSADSAIGLSGTTDLNDALVMYRDNALYTSTARNTNEFVYANSDKDIWLRIYANSLDMAWNISGTNNIWSASGTDENWNSRQGNDATDLEKIEHVFKNGDYVHFTGTTIPTGISIAIDAAGVKVAGMEVDNGGYTFTGNGGILASENLTETTGKYLTATGADRLEPDGKLTKKGYGTLTFQNTGGNRFEGGIDLSAGTIVFDRADQLGTGTNGIVFDGTAADNATLRAADSAVLTNKVTIAADKVGTIDARMHLLTFNTGTVSVGATGQLNLNAEIVGDKAGFLFLDNGVQGAGTIEKTGAGTAQIGADSAFNGMTSVSAGTFRVIEGEQYGGTGTLTLASVATMAGGGTVKAGTVTIGGTLSADSDKLGATKTTVGGDRRFGTLTFDADTTLQNGFRMEYDALVDANRTPRGDLLKVIGGNTLAFGTGTINLVNTEDELNGSYLIMEADAKILHSLNNDPDQVLTATLNDNPLSHYSVRGTYTFYQKQNDVLDPNGNQIWLDVEINSLNMTWQDTAADSVWTTTGGGQNWLSTQGDDAPPTLIGVKEKIFKNGDYVHFTTSTTPGVKSIEINGGIIVSGFDFSADSDYMFAGAGTIDAYETRGIIEGKYLKYAAGDPEKLTPDGKLRKNGVGTLTFANGANTFHEGIEITKGILAFTRADQLGDNGKGIKFLGNAILRSEDDITAPAALANDLKIADGVTATLDSSGYTFTVAGIIDEISGTGNLEKSGLGTLRLTNAANAWDGTTIVKSGTLQAVGVATLGTNTAGRTVTVDSNAELELEINGAAVPAETLAQKITGQGAVEKTGTKTLILTNNNDYAGGTTVTGGRLIAETLASAGGNVGTGRVTVGNGAIFELKLDTTPIDEGGIFAQQMTGAGKFVKSGAATVTLSRSDNDYTGNTEVAGGRIRITNVGAVGDNTATGVSAHEVFLNGTDTSLELALSADGTFNQRITGIGRLVKTDGTKATLTNANTFTGGTELAAGTLVLHDVRALNKTEAVAGSNRGFVFVTGNAAVSAGNGVTAVQNRFEVSQNVQLGIDSFNIVGNDVRGVNGGAIELENGAGFTSTEPLDLMDNRTNGDGGALYAPTERITVGGTGLNTIAALTGNSAVRGGGVYAKSVAVKGLGTGTAISGNTASVQGGAFYLVGGATSMLDATDGSITLKDNKASNASNAIHMNENVRLEMKGNHTINLHDGITSTVDAAHGNLIDISMSNVEDMREKAVNVHGMSDYYGNTDFNAGLVILHENSRFGKIASDNRFTQHSNAALAGSGTVSAKEIQLGGLINAGIYTPPPREADVATLNFIGSTSIGDLAAGQTAMNIDIKANEMQTADLMKITGDLKIAGDSLVDFNTFSVGRYLIARTTGGVTGYHEGPLYDQVKKSITDFQSTVAGYSLNPNRFEITYTLEDGDKDIYVNMTLHNEYLIWTGANAYVPPFSDEDGVDYVGHDEYRNDWLNERLYNWHQEKNGVSRDARFRQGDKVAFIGNDDRETAPGESVYLPIRENIEIVTFNDDDDTASGDSVAHVGDMVVTSGGTYRFTGRGIEASIDPFLPIEEEGAGQLYINGDATAIFANAANNFQRGIVLQNGSVAFNNPNQLGTTFVDDTYNDGITASHGITVEGNNSYGKLAANADGMTLGIVINIKEADSEIVIDTGGDDFGDSDVLGNYTLTLKHAEIDAHTDPVLGTPTPVNGIYGKGRLVKISDGTLILAEENYYKGGTVIENGTVAVAADNRLGEAGVGILLGNLKSEADATHGTFRALESFGTNRDIVLSLNGGAVEVDAGKTLTHSGVITDNNTATGIGDLSKTGEGIFVATNPGNDFRGNLNVDEGRFIAVTLETQGADDESRILSTKNNRGVRSILELQISGEQTLRQQLGGNGEVLKTGGGLLNLAVDSPNFNGYLNVASGAVHLTGDFGNGDSFRFQNGTILTGYGRLGGNGADGGVFESGSILAPGNVVADDPAVNPTSKSIYVDGGVTFKSGSLYQVVITQYPDPTFDPANPDRMRPVSDCLNVKNGTVTIENGAKLEVELDYWADNLIPFDFGEDMSGRWTIIDADDGADDNGTGMFAIADVELPRGIEMEHGWNGSLYQLWLAGNPTGVFTEIADSHNTKEVGTVLEELVTNKDPGTKDLIKILSQKEIDDETLLDVMRQMAGDLRVDGLAMALKMPWRQPFNRLDRDMFPYVPDPCEPIGCRKIHKHYKNEFWGEAYGRYTDTRSDGNAFSNRMTRAGTVIGVDRQICTYSLFGAAVNYSEPRMTQRTGKVELEDVEIGVYNMTKITGMYDVKSYFGYSHQRYDMRRHVYIPAGNRYDALLESFKNKTSGDGFAMSVELLRGFRYNDYVKFTPLLAVDYEYVWQKGYTEKGGMTALRHGSTNLERLMMRVGLNVKAEVRDRLDLFGRIQYATQLNRTEYARGKTWFAAAENPSTMDIHGVAVGRDYLNLGIGTEYFFKGTKRATSLYVNYDADFWKRQTTHTGNLGFVHRW